MGSSAGSGAPHWLGPGRDDALRRRGLRYTSPPVTPHPGPKPDLPASPAASPAAAALLRWFDEHRRDLPWRRTRDPYAVWVSEVMLQQTRVETALPYYERFVARYPDVGALAAAPLEEVLATWSGLGYYRRARQMHAAARQIAEGGGRFPEDREGLAGLPGIGPYTASALASICFGEAVPVMDGNVERVTARLLALDADPKAAAPRRRLLAAAAALLDPSRPGDSNQALMELGGSVCTPRRPRCLLCPLREPVGAGETDHPGCAARQEGDPERYPPPLRRRPTQTERRLVAVVAREEPGAVLLFRRGSDEDVLPGTWELPWVSLEEDGTEASGLPPADALRARYGVAFELGERCGEVRHGITHRALTLEVRRAELSELAEPYGLREARWVPLAGLARLPLSSMVGKALAAALPGAGVTDLRPVRARRRRA